MTQEIKTEKFEGLLVKAPNGASGYKITPHPVHGVIFDIKYGLDICLIDLPQGQWKLIGNPFEFSRQQCADIVKYVGLPWNAYKDYTTNSNWFNNPVDSFNSLLKSLQAYNDNPYGCKPEFVFNAYGKSPIEFARFEADMFKWQQAEERTGNWILLEKLNN